VLEPGFVFKIPYFQTVRTLPTRSRTMDVPNQKVTSADGLVWFVDVNLVYRIVDIRKALIEIDDLVHGMQQMMSLSVQEIVSAARRDSLRLSGELDGQLARSMGARLEAWGVAVEHAGFISIKPSPKTLRFTQQLHSTEERRRNLELLVSRGLDQGLALAMLGSAPRISRRALRATAREEVSRRRRRILRSVDRALRESGPGVSASLRAETRAAAVRHLV
jgi:regulator of protease activity HflC (stomatin/prohibitin superfamily)